MLIKRSKNRHILRKNTEIEINKAPEVITSGAYDYFRTCAFNARVLYRNKTS